MDAPARPAGGGNDRPHGVTADDPGPAAAGWTGADVGPPRGARTPSVAAAPVSALPSEWPEVLAVLDEARARGFVGGGQDLDGLADHARGFLGPIAEAIRVLDLGSGGGVPGLVVAAFRPDATLTLLDASVGRTDWLRRVVGRLGWGARVRVVTARAEVLAHEDAWRGSQDAVVARSFAPPLVTAEVACAFLRGGGRLVVSEPPTHDPTRWPTAALAELGLRAQPSPDPRYAVLETIAPPQPEIPRARVVRGHTS